MATSIDEKRKSISNSRSDVLDARVIANYGDPGIDENYHFDILSRYVIVMIESAYRIPTSNKWNTVFAVVLRPKHLWISTEGGRASSPNSQRRSDAMGNISIGLADDFSVAGIPRINEPYQLGELIKIKKLATPMKMGSDSFFNSEFTDSVSVYENWHTEGSTLPYFAGRQEIIDYLRGKTIYKPDTTRTQEYAMKLYKYQYEAFFLSLILGNSALTSHASSIFANTIPSSSPIYHADGGYAFKAEDSVYFLSTEFEDINVNGKQRVATNECMPLIVTTPNSFPIPRVREIGTINYNPTYSPIITED